MRKPWNSLSSIVLAAVMIPAVALAVALPLRWSGARTPTTMWLPLGPVNAEQAVLLLEKAEVNKEGQPTSAILGFDDNLVRVGSKQVLFPAERNQAEAYRRFDLEGRTYTLHASSWGPYYSLYELPRDAFEQALGRGLVPGDAQPGAFGSAATSFDASKIEHYALIEFLVLALTIFAVLETRRRSARWWPAMLVLAGAHLTLLAQIDRYVPKLSNADSFYHRILLEPYAVWGIFLVLVPALVLGLMGAGIELGKKLRGGALEPETAG